MTSCSARSPVPRAGRCAARTRGSSSTQDAAKATARVDFEGLDAERAAAAGSGPARASLGRGRGQRVRRSEPDHGLPRPPGAGAVPGLALRAPRRAPRSPRRPAVRGRGPAAVLRAVAERAAPRPRRHVRVRRALHAARPGRDARAAGPHRAGPPGHPRRPAGPRLDRVDEPAAGRPRRAADARRVRAAGRRRRAQARRRRHRAALRDQRARERPPPTASSTG